MPNPFAARASRDRAPSFPEARLRRAGMTDAELAEARTGWDGMSEREQGETVAALQQLTEEELVASILEQREDIEQELPVEDDDCMGEEPVLGVVEPPAPKPAAKPRKKASKRG